jgi:hypothetical protein
MDVNTLYAAVDLGAQEEYDTQIVKEVWNNDTSNFTQSELGSETNICEATYESQGADAYNRCYNAALSCGSDSNCNALAVKYAQALNSGYSTSFEDFKKKTGTLSAVGEIATGLLGGLLGKLGGGSREGDIQLGGGGYYEPQQKSNKGMYIGIGIVALIGIGAAVYFARKK